MLELARLDVAQRAIWKKVVKGDLAAIDRLLKIMQRRAKLIGLDAPVKLDVRQMVRETAAELGLSQDEAKETFEAIERMLAQERSRVGDR